MIIVFIDSVPVVPESQEVAASDDDSEFAWDLLPETIKLGDKINYWLTINVWGDDSTMRCGTVVKILPAKELYEPHLYLDNGDTVHFCEKIRRVEESMSDDGITKQSIHGLWRFTSSYDYIPSEDKNSYHKSLTRDSNMFKKIVDTACKVAEATILGNNNRESSLVCSEIYNNDESRNLGQMEDSND